MDVRASFTVPMPIKPTVYTELMSKMTKKMVVVAIMILLAKEVGGHKYDVPGLFLFGDSLLDVGTNSLIQGCDITANFPPYGESYFDPPTGRFSNGLIPSDFYAQLLGLPVFPPPYINFSASYKYGINFASAGAGLLDATRSSALVLSVGEQILQFQAVKPKLDRLYGPKLVKKSIYIISAGNNDLQVYYFNATAEMTIPLTDLVASLIKELDFLIETLYAEGARKVVVFALGPLGCLPFMRAINPNGTVNVYGCKDEINDGIKLFNSGLIQLLEDVRVRYKDLYIVYVDSYKVIYEFVSNGNQYGFTEMSTACCGAGLFNGLAQCGTHNLTTGNDLYTLCSNATLPEYVFFDWFHPTEKVYNLTVNLAWYGGSMSTTHPISIRELAEVKL